MLRKFHWPLELKHVQRAPRRRSEQETRFETLFIKSFRKSRERTRTPA